MKTAVTQAEKLASSAMKGFESAHTKLVKANDLIDQHRAEARADAERWKREVEEHIARQQAAVAAADDAYAKNERRIAKIADFLEI